jgi:hypothetical protein
MSLDSQFAENVLEKVCDVSEVVRKAAFATIRKKIDLEALSIENRQRVFSSGLSDAAG